ncbi:hypothetical protein PPERSA_11014 [Pseudocohnilembus persalinus]|uniref:Uncharacterized protein n=1 Tax=Pseudocohnilembus persalinus TaxID=266149 RepID=A0A0V0QYP6_PSEPJ|nr:hypothetical protein PPERSA_11014 [Pseudocohnilembus persalinus]|eukprot:KRX07465.1 hypothetical protein PPERSA_11014 [Pseudocohnilembus persalinus]
MLNYLNFKQIKQIDSLQDLKQLFVKWCKSSGLVKNLSKKLNYFKSIQSEKNEYDYELMINDSLLILKSYIKFLKKLFLEKNQPKFLQKFIKIEELDITLETCTQNYDRQIREDDQIINHSLLLNIDKIYSDLDDYEKLLPLLLKNLAQSRYLFDVQFDVSLTSLNFDYQTIQVQNVEAKSDFVEFKQDQNQQIIQKKSLKKQFILKKQFRIENLIVCEKFANESLTQCQNYIIFCEVYKGLQNLVEDFKNKKNQDLEVNIDNLKFFLNRKWLADIEKMHKFQNFLSFCHENREKIKIRKIKIQLYLFKGKKEDRERLKKLEKIDDEFEVLDMLFFQGQNNQEEGDDDVQNWDQKIEYEGQYTDIANQEKEMILNLIKQSKNILKSDKQYEKVKKDTNQNQNQNKQERKKLKLIFSTNLWEEEIYKQQQEEENMGKDIEISLRMLKDKENQLFFHNLEALKPWNVSQNGKNLFFKFLKCLTKNEDIDKVFVTHQNFDYVENGQVLSKIMMEVQKFQGFKYEFINKVLDLVCYGQSFQKLRGYRDFRSNYFLFKRIRMRSDIMQEKYNDVQKSQLQIAAMDKNVKLLFRKEIIQECMKIMNV